jgi:hypothetical protein
VNQLIDLTEVSINFRLEFDTLDAVLLVTTGGVGYLARAAYRHFNGRSERSLDAQRENFVSILDEAQRKGASRLIIRVNPNVPLYAPCGGDIRYLARTASYNEVEITIR